MGRLTTHVLDTAYGLPAAGVRIRVYRVEGGGERQLLREGRIHGYLRMLWGKRVLEWTRSPREALIPRHRRTPN